MQESSGEKYRFLILGGCGFIGRHLVEFLIKNNIAEKIRVVDKIPPQLAWFNKYHKDVFSCDFVEFKSANLINQLSCQKAFDDDQGFDFVINLAAETRLGQDDGVYNEGVFKLSINCAKEAAKRKIKFIEISTGEICSSKDEKVKEIIQKPSPWTLIAKYKFKVEQELNKIHGLDHVILRLAIVYGVGDKKGLMPRLTIGAIYNYLNETLKLLWNNDLKMNTVNVLDVCRTIWFVCKYNHITLGNIYNVVDKNDSTQGQITKIISQIYNIKHEFLGKTASTIALKTNCLDIHEINDKHMTAWSDICNKFNINNTPINPYLYPELLQEKHLNLNGDKLESLGFSYQIPKLTNELLIEILDDYCEMNLFPKLHTAMS